MARLGSKKSPLQQARKLLKNGVPIYYVATVDILPEIDLHECISSIEPNTTRQEAKLCVNSEDFYNLRLIHSTNGSIILCIPVDAIVKFVLGRSGWTRYIVFSAPTRTNPTNHTVCMAHIIECYSEQAAVQLHSSLSKTMEYIKTLSKPKKNSIAPLFQKNITVNENETIKYQNVSSKHGNNELLKAVSCPSTRNRGFQSAFQFLKEGNSDGLVALIKSGFDLLTCDDHCENLLHFAVKLNSFRMAKCILSECTNNLNREIRLAQNREGKTPLHMAAIDGNKDFVRLLAIDFETVNVKDIKGRTPLHYCAGRLSCRELHHILIDHGAQIEVKEIDNISPLKLEPELKKIQELSVTGAFAFINNLNLSEGSRTAWRTDSGIDISSGFDENYSRMYSPDSIASSNNLNSLSSDADSRIKALLTGSFTSGLSNEDEIPGFAMEMQTIQDRMRLLRDEMSRLINLLNNNECFGYMEIELNTNVTQTKLITLARHPKLTEECATAIALMFHQFFTFMCDNKCSTIDPSLLHTLVCLLESHVIIQSQAISIIEEILKITLNEDKDNISSFAQLKADLFFDIIRKNDAPINVSKETRENKLEAYTKRFRSLSSPSDFGDSFRTGNIYFTNNWSRRLLLRILSRTSFLPAMRNKLGEDHICRQVLDLARSPTMEIQEHALSTLANMSLSYSNHQVLVNHGVIEFLRGITDTVQPVFKHTNVHYHAARALVYLGMDNIPFYLFDSSKEVVQEILWSHHKAVKHVFVKGASLEDIVKIVTNDPKLLWGDVELKQKCSVEDLHPTKVEDNEIIKFILSMHHTFADSVVFMRLLVHRIRDFKVDTFYHEDDVPPLYRKVINIICIWMETFRRHFLNDTQLLVEVAELLDFLIALGGPCKFLCEQITKSSESIKPVSTTKPTPNMTHVNLYKFCRSSLNSGEVPFSVYTIAWLSALRGVIESSSACESSSQGGFLRSLLNFKDRELVRRVKEFIPPHYHYHDDVIAFTKNLYETLNSQDISNRELQHLFIDAYFRYPLYQTELFYDILLQEESERLVPIIVGINNHHFVIVSRHTNDIIGHHALSGLTKPIQWYSNSIVVSLDSEYTLVGQNPYDIEMLATLLVKYLGDKIEIVDTMFYTADDVEIGITPHNRHSWHSNTNNVMFDGILPNLTRDHPPTPCTNSYIDISKASTDFDMNNGVHLLEKTRSRLSLNLSNFNSTKNHYDTVLRRVHTTSDMAISESLHLVESVPRTTITDRLRGFSSSIASKLDSLKSEYETYSTSEEENSPICLNNLDANEPISLIGPPMISDDNQAASSSSIHSNHFSKRSIKRSPRSTQRSWERGVVNIDPETSQEMVIITEKCNVLRQLKSSPPVETNSQFHLRVKSNFKNIDTASFTKLVTQSYEAIMEKRLHRRSSVETIPDHLSESRDQNRIKHHVIRRSKSFTSNFDKLISNRKTRSSSFTDTPEELERFSDLFHHEDMISKIRQAQGDVFYMQCSCPDNKTYEECPCPPDPDLPFDFSFDRRRMDESKLLLYHREIARQLTLWNHHLFANLSEQDLLEASQYKDDLDDSMFPSIKMAKGHFEMLVLTVKTMLLQCEVREQRVKILEHFIDIAHQCLVLRNFETLCAIASAALKSASITNLRDTWSGVSPRHLSIFHKLGEILSFNRNYKTYRAFLRNSDEPTVPLLVVHQTDMHKVSKDHTDYLKNGLINLQKRRVLYVILEELRYYQQKKYNFVEIPEIITFFQNYKRYVDENECYIRSLKLSNARRPKRRSYLLLS